MKHNIKLSTSPFGIFGQALELFFEICKELGIKNFYLQLNNIYNVYIHYTHHLFHILLQKLVID